MNHALRAAMIGLAAILLFGTVAHAEFPERNITSVVTFSPGGGFDTILRAISGASRSTCPRASRPSSRTSPAPAASPAPSFSTAPSPTATPSDRCTAA